MSHNGSLGIAAVDKDSVPFLLTELGVGWLFSAKTGVPLIRLEQQVALGRCLLAQSDAEEARTYYHFYCPYTLVFQHGQLESLGALRRSSVIQDTSQFIYYRVYGIV